VTQRSTTAPVVAPRSPKAPDVTQARWRRVGFPWTARISLVFLLTCAALAALGPLITPHPYTQISLTERLMAPWFAGGGSEYILGTDSLGRDVLSRIIMGLRVSLVVGFGGVALGCVIGTIVGLCAGYFRGVTEGLLMGLVDVKLALPGILLAIGIIAVFGSSFFVLVLVIGLSNWVGFGRVVRSLVVTLRAEEFVTAARSLGASQSQIVMKHLLPNCLNPIIVLATLYLPNAIILEASLSFLGIGIQAPTPSLGNMVSESRQYLSTSPWQVLLPSAFLVALTITSARLGDWLSKALDPRQGS
jgi:peptide/nickel transport system permease protein